MKLFVAISFLLLTSCVSMDCSKKTTVERCDVYKTDTEIKTICYEVVVCSH